MSTLDRSPEVRGMLESAGPYLALGLERAARYALRLHAEELAIEHLFASLLEDEECGATRLVLHAFADPETLAVEVLALCPGIMVVGSKHCLPFSVRGVRALEAARGRAMAGGEDEVASTDLLRAAAAELPAETHRALVEAGLTEEGGSQAPAGAPVVVLGTAHPAKFPDAVERATGVRPPLPDQLADLMNREERYSVLPNDLKIVQDHIRENARA